MLVNLMSKVTELHADEDAPTKNDPKLVAECRELFPRARRGKLVLSHRWERQAAKLSHEAHQIVLPMRRRAAGNRTVSDSTKRSRLDMANRFIRALCFEGLQLNSLREIGERHVSRYMKWMAASGCSRKYCNNVYVQLRNLVERGLGKYNCVKPFEHYLGNGVISRLNATASKAITGKSDANGIALDAEELTERVGKVDPLAGLLAKVSLYAGLRRNEAICMQPHRALHSDRELCVWDGAKNTRPRLVDLSLVPEFHSKALAIIEEMKTFCQRPEHTLLQGRRLETAQRRYGKACESAGLTRNDLGVTPHGFRHEWVHRAWVAAGHVVPLRGGLPQSSTDARSLSLQVIDQRILIESVGHSDPSKCGSYYGSHFKQRVAASVSRKEWSRALGRVADIPRGDVEALRRRREEVLTMALDVLDEIVIANFLQGTQWEQPICPVMRFMPPPSNDRP
jgi:integrase